MFESFCCHCGMLLLVLLTALIAFVYQFIVRSWSYFNERNVKCVRGFPLLGSAFKSVVRVEPAAVSYRRLYDQFPKEKCIGIYEFGGNPSYLIRDPDLIKQIMITDFDHFVNNCKFTYESENDLIMYTLFGLQGSKWNQSRQALFTAFSADKLQSMHTLMVRTSKEFIKSIKDADKTAKIFNSRTLFSRYTNDIIASTVFGIDVNSMRNKNNDLFVAINALSGFSHINELKYLASLSFPSLVNLFNCCNRKEEKNSEHIIKIVKETIEERKKSDIARNDVIEFLIRARDGQVQNSNEKDNMNLGYAVKTPRSIDSKVLEAAQSKSKCDIAQLFVDNLSKLELTVKSFMQKL